MKKWFKAFEGVHLGTHFCKDTCLVPRTCTDFEYFMLWLDMEKLCLKSHSIRLRDGLLISYGKCYIAIRPFLKSPVQKTVPWNCLHGTEHILVTDAFLAQGLDEFIAQPLMSVGIFFQVAKI